MAPLDWAAIEGVKPDSLSEEKADELFEILKDVSVNLYCQEEKKKIVKFSMYQHQALSCNHPLFLLFHRI